uniref:hypothetical protein n=1 Tax=Rhodanobacter sp. DHG33 TaxID=2775921 RepID=UPI00178762E7|nr:hypothetical protein [Rhodanobacter sp. DHG33]MBD8900202.1 hypothetical protein [Rhodanobacter sp. DHG33]
MTKISMDVNVEEGFSTYERKLYAEVDRILYQNYLSPRTITDFWQGDRDGVVHGLKALKVRAVRIIVLSHYVEIDDALGMIIYRRLVPKGRRAINGKVVRVMIDGMHLLHKLDTVATFQRVSKETVNAVRGINQLRNTMAHRHGMSPIPLKDRKYKDKYDIFTIKGLTKMKEDMHAIDMELQPNVMRLAMELVRDQKNAAAERGRQSRKRST